MAKVAIVTASGFEQDGMTSVCQGLARAGHQLVIVSPKKHAVRAWNNTHWGVDLPVDVAAGDAQAQTFAAVVLPGGLMGADVLRADADVVRLLSDAALQGKPVATIGHAGWVLIEAGLAKGRAMTGAPSIRSDLVHAGASWQNAAVVADGKVITGQHSHDAAAVAAHLQGMLAQGSG